MTSVLDLAPVIPVVVIEDADDAAIDAGNSSITSVLQGN